VKQYEWIERITRNTRVISARLQEQLHHNSIHRFLQLVTANASNFAEIHKHTNQFD